MYSPLTRDTPPPPKIPARRRPSGRESSSNQYLTQSIPMPSDTDSTDTDSSSIPTDCTSPPSKPVAAVTDENAGSAEGGGSVTLIPIPQAPTIIETIEAASDTATVSRGITPEMRKAAEYRMRGKTLQQIADELGKQRQTISRWLSVVADEAREHLETQSGVNLLTDEIERLNDIEAKARKAATYTGSSRQRTMALNTALRACAQRADLMLKSGLIPKEPDRIYQQVISLKPQEKNPDETGQDQRTKDELIDELMQKIGRIESV